MFIIPISSNYIDTYMDWHNADIKAELEKRGLTLAGLARMYRIAPTTLRTTLVRRYSRGEKIIAKHIGIPPEQIWPSRYPGKTVKHGAQL